MRHGEASLYLPDSMRQEYFGRTWEGLVLHVWPETKGLVYRQVMKAYDKAFLAYFRDVDVASEEIFCCS